jgi:hypothetical protein
MSQDTYRLIDLNQDKDYLRRAILLAEPDCNIDPKSNDLRPTKPEGIGSSRCSRCPGFIYVLPEEFRDHSKSQWHLFNLRRNPGEQLLFEDWCQTTEEDALSVSSSSGSSGGSEYSPDLKRVYIHGIHYNESRATGIYFPVVLGNPETLLNASFISVLLLRAGRFAGAVWDADGHVLAHTSFKRYTVRRKNGGSQSKNDRSKGSPAQSIGAQLRREQEKKLSEEVTELVSKTWSRYFSDSNSVVFAYASKGQMDDLHVGPLDRRNPKCKLLKIPMSVRDPTFSEVCRIHKSLTRFAIRNDVPYP